MVVVVWVIVVVGLCAWWVLRLDTPDRNPFVLARVYRAIAFLLLALVILLSYKAVIWNRDLRQLILDTCR